MTPRATSELHLRIPPAEKQQLREEARRHGISIAAGFYFRDEKGQLRASRWPNSLRHTFASFAIAAKVPTFELARFMGTSVKQIEETYGHLLPDAHERARVALDGFESGDQSEKEAEHV